MVPPQVWEGSAELEFVNALENKTGLPLNSDPVPGQAGVW